MPMSIKEAVDLSYEGFRPGAAKRGRNPRWPYVPIVHKDLARNGRGATEQIKGKAFETREQAVAYAEKTIAFWRQKFEELLRDPRRGRATREQFDIEGEY